MIVLPLTRLEMTLSELRQYQKSTNLAISRIAFTRVVEDIVKDLEASPNLRWQPAALDALQQCAEAYLVSLFEGRSSREP